ncbi:MAG: alpha/beta fold hydrolase [Fluviibacter sp.]|jgi:pimeloyl-[acyl-carrier protein] methyl ester esterase
MMPTITPMVLLHGWGFLPGIWHAVIEQLEQQGLRASVIAPALPLSGNISQLTAIESLFETLPDTAHLVGWSLGGELALAYTLCFPERVRSLTLISSTPCFMQRPDWDLGQPATLLDDFDQRLIESPAALLKRFSTLIRHGDTTAIRDRTLSEQLQQYAEPDAERLSSGLKFLRTIDLRAACTSQTDLPPISLIHGSADGVVPLAAAEWLSNELKAKLTIFEHASHALPLTHAEQITANLVHNL